MKFRKSCCGLWVAMALVAPLSPPAASAALPLVSLDVAPLKVGAASVDASWHVGASSGQYGNDGASVGERGIDPYNHTTRKNPSYGLASRTTVRAIAIEGSNAERFVIVATDLYLSQDLLVRRAGQLIEARNLGVTSEQVSINASHSHSSPYYSTPSWGVWVFQDVFDIRFYEYMAERIALAVDEAIDNLEPARMSAHTLPFNEITSHTYGPQVGQDGSPAGQPWNYTTGRVSNVFFETPTGEPIANWVVHGMHPEFSSGDDLVSGDFHHALYRMVDRTLGGVTVMTQDDVGASGPHKELRVHQPEARREYLEQGFSEMDRAARKLADVVIAARAVVETGVPIVAWQSTADVASLDLSFAPPVTRPYPGVSNCNTEQAFHGNPGVPVAGLPDCEFPFSGEAPDEVSEFGADVYTQLKQLGIPIPESYSATAYGGLEETLSVRLQVLKVGPIAATFCPCEQFTDQSNNIISRLNKVAGDIFRGFDWAETQVTRGAQPRAFCVANVDSSWTCANPKNTSQDLVPISDFEYRRMRAQIQNDASGWDTLEYAPYAEAEPIDTTKIKGNFTHEEFPSAGYDLVLTVGMSNDYWGYVPSYRDYRAFDHYRKALNGLGPHGADFLATRLSRMAASLNGATTALAGLVDTTAQVDEAGLDAKARALGEISRAHKIAYEATLPPDLVDRSFAVVKHPYGGPRFTPQRITFIGGNPYDDLPKVRVERCALALNNCVLSGWEPFADDSGEIQLRVKYPQDATELALWRAGQFEWEWSAIWETFNSDISQPDAKGVSRNQTPAGRYRYVVEGQRRGLAGALTPYRLANYGFYVVAWDGIRINQPTIVSGGAKFSLANVSTHVFNRDAKGRALPMLSYDIGPIDYPDAPREFGSHVADFDYLFDAQRLIFSYGLPMAQRDRFQQYCSRCSFRPWTDISQVASAYVTVTRAGGGPVERFVATQTGPNEFFAAVALNSGDNVQVKFGDVVDTFGERNIASAGVSKP